jgi:GT2 family glycosyltransferase
VVLARDTERHGSAADAVAETLSLATSAGVVDRITPIDRLGPDHLSKCDILTNSGHLRPISADVIECLPREAVIALMFEAWEFRGADLDIEACARRGIRVAAVDERHPDVAVFPFLGPLCVKLLADADMPVRGKRIAVLCDNPFSTFIKAGLEDEGAETGLYANVEDVPAQAWDAVVVAFDPGREKMTRGELEILADRAPRALLAQFWGNIDRPAASNLGFRLCPRVEPRPGHMGILLNALGHEPIVRLQAGGLRAAELVFRGHDPSKDGVAQLLTVPAPASTSATASFDRQLMETGGRNEHVCVVIVTYNSASVLSGLLDSIPAGLKGVRDYQVIVVDNRSQDHSAQLAADHPVRPRVIKMDRNGGYAAGINAAASAAGSDAHLLILNPDLRLMEGAVRLLLDQMRTSTAGIALPRNLGEDGTVSLTIRREPSISTVWCESVMGGNAAARLGVGEMVAGDRRYNQLGPVEWATGSALMVSARARRAVGAWDESFFLYSEEVDYQRRVRQAGLDVIYVPQSRVVHIRGEYRVNTRLYALLTSNRIRYFRRNHNFLSTVLFRLGIATGEALRFWRGPVHRRALVCALLPLKPALSFRNETPTDAVA